MNSPARKDMEILLVEDSPTDADLTREGLLEAHVSGTLRVVTDGVQAMRYLRHEGEYSAAARPDLVLLDLKLPRKPGLDVLRDIKNDPELRDIPVVVLSTSDAERDIRRSYDLHANCYFTKPMDINVFIDLMRTISDHWLAAAKLPSRARLQ